MKDLGLLKVELVSNKNGTHLGPTGVVVSKWSDLDTPEAKLGQNGLRVKYIKSIDINFDVDTKDGVWDCKGVLYAADENGKIKGDFVYNDGEKEIRVDKKDLPIAYKNDDHWEQVAKGHFDLQTEEFVGKCKVVLVTE